MRPFSVIGGFLGAGKTTLINRLLTQAGSIRYAVLVNDFGSINVDTQLIDAHDGQTMALTNGCICCSMSDGFIQTMLRLMAQPDRFDHVIVEASGVSEPDRIMDIARLDPQLSADLIVTLVDGEGIGGQLLDPQVDTIVARQIECADLLLINKIDRVPKMGRAKIGERLRVLNDRALILECQVNRSVPEQLLSLRALRDLDRAENEQRPIAPLDLEFYAASLVADHPVGRDRFSAFCQCLPTTVLRGKGLVHFEERPGTVFEWHRVGRRERLDVAHVVSNRSEIVLIATEPLAESIGAGLFRLG